MPYYQCPKCSGRDTYEGTELVSGSKGGGAIIGPENDLGFSPVVGVGGRTATNEQTVVKCKVCDINLGQKDIRYSKQELEQLQAAKKNLKTKKSIILVSVITAAIVGSIVFFGPISKIPEELIETVKKPRKLSTEKQNKKEMVLRHFQWVES